MANLGNTLLCAALLLGCAPLPAQDAGVRDAFQQARTLWAAQGDREGATARFEQVLTSLEPKARSLDPEWTRILCETYNWLAVLDDRSPGKKVRVPKHLEAMLELDPDFDLDRTVTNARVQGQFDTLRAQKLTRLKISLQPEGGVLRVDGKARPAGMVPRFLPPGPHAIVYAKPGYALQEHRVDLALKEPKALDFRLERVSSTVTVHTQPVGVEVFLDGRPLGKTQGQAGASLKTLAEKAGIALEQLSDGFVVDGLTPGKHVVELRAPCYRTRRLELDPSFASPLADHLLEPVRLEPSRGSLTVLSAAPGGELFLDDKPQGSVPVKDLQVCSGAYELRVRYPAGGFARRIEVTEGQALSLEVAPRPRLALLGLEGQEAFAGRDRLLKALEGLGARVERAACLPAHPGETPDQTLARVKSEGEAELTLLLRPLAAHGFQDVELILGTLTGEEERSTVKPLEEDPFRALVARLNAVPTLFEPSLGLALLDVPGEKGPWVLQAEPTLLQAGVKPGRALLEIGGKPVATVAEARQHLLEAKGPRIALNQGEGPVEVLLGRQALELPVASPALCYPLVLADLRLRLQSAKGEEAGLLRLNQALALMHFRAFDKAVEVLREARTPVLSGVSQGTLDYYTGLCLLRLGTAFHTEAQKALTACLTQPRATLFGPEGPSVAPLARQALEDLKP